ncbi:MAG: hypothetical protein QM497_04740 [Sulfurimonas sp.]
MSKYFNTAVYDPVYKRSDIDQLLQDKMTYIAGDFWGIQNFIFDGLTTKNAAKVLRSKSAFVQIYTELLTKYICFTLSIDEKYIISNNAGKFEILVPMESVDIKNIQEKVDDYFIKNFFGLSGISIVSLSLTKDDWTKNYKAFRDTLAINIENAKYQKFNLLKQTPILEYDTNLDNQTLCKVCNIRKIEDENCHTCNTFIELGKKLTQKQAQEIYADELGIFFDDFNPKIKLDNRIKSYIPNNDYGKPLSFSDIANNSCNNNENGIKALGILKADVDSMGNFIKQSNVIQSFENFDEFSKGIDAFFSLYIPKLLRAQYRNIYTVFAGGDDLFLVGAWDQIMQFSRIIQEEFKTYVNYNKTKLSISFGISIAKPATPISYLAGHTEELLEASKDLDGKDGLSIWSESVKWKSYIEVYTNLEQIFQNYQNLETVTVYRFLEFCNMSKNVASDIKNSMWKSKLNYLFSRNMNMDKDKELLMGLDKYISQNPSETKIYLSEFVYKRRAV